MKPDLFWISGPWLGKLAIVSRPRGGEWLDDEAAAWSRAGIGVMVSLLESTEMAELELTSESDAARSMAAYTRNDQQLAGESGEPVKLAGFTITSGFFHLLGFKPQLGREFTAPMN